MKTLTKILSPVVGVFLLSLLPAAVNGESLADRRSDTPVETWGNREAELERATFVEHLPPTAAGPASAEHQQGEMMQDDSKHGDMGHGAKQSQRASDYKREVFGSNR